MNASTLLHDVHSLLNSRLSHTNVSALGSISANIIYRQIHRKTVTPTPSPFPDPAPGLFVPRADGRRPWTPLSAGQIPFSHPEPTAPLTAGTDRAASVWRCGGAGATVSVRVARKIEDNARLSDSSDSTYTT